MTQEPGRTSLQDSSEHLRGNVDKVPATGDKKAQWICAVSEFVLACHLVYHIIAFYRYLTMVLPLGHILGRHTSMHGRNSTDGDALAAKTRLPHHTVRPLNIPDAKFPTDGCFHVHMKVEQFNICSITGCP
jgi:hypothetical protein